MNKLLYMTLGAAITVVFFWLACSSNAEINIFDRVYYNAQFNDQVYSNSLYPMIAAIMGIMSWGGAAVYYYVINSVNFDRWYHWAGVLVVVTLLTPIICYFFINSSLASVGVDMSGATMQFVIRLMIITAVLFVVASFSMRWWSSNCRHTPFPQ